MGHKIAVEGIKIYAYHGCLDEEAKIGGHYIVDVYMETDFTVAAQTDDLALTVDYCTVYEIAKKEMAIRAKLIETVAERIHKNVLKTFPMVTKTRVKLTKLSPPMNGNVEKVYVEVE